jgi:hypothetical protein
MKFICARFAEKVSALFIATKETAIRKPEMQEKIENNLKISK